ncbi:MAG: MBL fold metallo-hydrolase [Solirubrobacterales bacterium]|nr:MBL fold metallo-hydrolase [Solirubrobacterales bacterium]MBV9942905.1 MBL fold metallo-hydrolase [Solirubrobacterales bacterium]
MPREIDQHQVAENVFAFTGTETNWIIVQDGTDLTLIDAGWHGDIKDVEASIRLLGRQPQDVRVVLLTHAHADHTGALNYLHDNYGAPLYMDPLEVSNALGDTYESGGPINVARRLYRPQVVRWAARMIKAGGLKHYTFPSAQPFPQAGPLDLPGRPVPIASPGHTSGHCSFLLPHAGVLITGDALVTAHPLFNGVGPRLLPADWSHDQTEAINSLGAFRDLDTDTFIPGHGPVWHGPINDALDRALDQVRRGHAVR